MIVKKIPNPKKSNLKVERVTKLIEYISNPSEEDDSEKCVLYGWKNFIGDDPASHILEMSALANDCVRSKDPINHYVISWREGEHPTDEQVHEAAEMFIDGLGLKDHQYVYGLHTNTKNMHVHIVVNRVNPITERAVEINEGWDIEAAHSALYEIEKKQGWKPAKNSVFQNHNGGKVRSSSKKSPDGITSEITKNELLHGEQSALRQAKEHAPNIIKSAKSWHEMHRELAKNGMQYKKKGSGALIYFNDQPLKASSVDRDFTLAKLEKRLGKFEEASPRLTIVKQEAKSLKPFDAEFSEYKTEMAKNKSDKKQEWDKLIKQQKDTRDKKIKEQAVERNTELAENWVGRGEEKNRLRYAISVRHKKQRDEMQARFEEEKKQIKNKYGDFPTIEEWRKRRGVPDQVFEIEGAKQYLCVIKIAFVSAVFVSESTAAGVIYRRSDGAQEIAFIDRGNKISVYDHGSDDSVLEALKIAQNRFGSVVINGNDDFKMTVARLAVANNINIASLDVIEMMELFKPAISIALPEPVREMPIIEPEPEPELENLLDVWMRLSGQADIECVEDPIAVTQLMLDNGMLSKADLRDLASQYLYEVVELSEEAIEERRNDWIECGDIDEERRLATSYIVHLIREQIIVVPGGHQGNNGKPVNPTNDQQRKNDSDGLEIR